MSHDVRFRCVPRMFCFKTITENVEIHIPETPEIEISGRIGLDIQEEIMKRLPVKSLLRFMCVSKAWKSLIHSSRFIAAHHTHQRHHLLVRFSSGNFGSIAEDDVTFNCCRKLVPTPLPKSLKLLEPSSIVLVGTSHGLFCFSGMIINSQLYNPQRIERVNITVIWNPSIRKSIPVAIPYPKKLLTGHEVVVGFGVCSATSDPKMVAITQFGRTRQQLDKSHVWEVDVCTLSSGKWTSLSSNLPSKSIRVKPPQVVIGTCIYWMGLDNRYKPARKLIMSFDMTDDNFKVVDLPDRLALPGICKELSIFKIGESLAIIEYDVHTDAIIEYDVDTEGFYRGGVYAGGGYVVRMIEHDGDQRSFTKAFTIKAPNGSTLMGFRESGRPIIETDFLFGWHDSRNFTPLEFSRIHNMFVNSYMETLFLLGRYDSSSC